MSDTLPQRGFLHSEAMQEAVRGLRAAIASQGGVLISGECGTGRELFARAIHRASCGGFDGSVERLIRDEMAGPPAAACPLVVVDCSRTADLESRLFGCEPASGAGANLERISDRSAIHAALEGSLLLTQVPEMPSRVQHRLARVLRDGEAVLVTDSGAAGVVRVWLRVMGTMEPASGREGDDGIHPELQRRLGGTVIHLPPLRDRKEDIPGLAKCLLADACARASVPPKTLSTQASDLLSALPWRGNVDELQQLMETLARRVAGRLVRLSDVLAHVRLDGRASTFIYSGTLREARERFEREYVAHVLEQHHGRMAEAAKALGIQRTNLYRKMRKLAVNRQPPRHR